MDARHWDERLYAQAFGQSRLVGQGSSAAARTLGKKLQLVWAGASAEGSVGSIAEGSVASLNGQGYQLRAVGAV